MFDEVGPQFAHKLVQEEGWAYVDGEVFNKSAADGGRWGCDFGCSRCSPTE